MSNKKYSNEDLAKALEDIKNGSMTIYRASKVYNIPNQTLHDKINKKYKKTRVSRSSNSPVIDRRRFVGKMDLNVLELFVRGCRMDLDRARSKLEAYCVARSRCKDLYEYRSLSSSPLSDVCKFIDVIVLPKLTDEGYRVTVFRIRPEYPESAADITNVVRAILLVSDVRMHDEQLIAGDVFVYEISQVRGTVVAHIATAFNAIRRAIQLAQAAYPQRLKRIHVVGAPPFIASSLALMRSCVNEKIKRRYYLHSKVDELLEHIPAHVLPAEWGGEEENIEALCKKWQQRIDDVSSYLRLLTEACNATPAPVNDVDIFGTVGAFRKLDID